MNPDEPEELFPEDQQVEITDLPDKDQLSNGLRPPLQKAVRLFRRKRPLQLVVLATLCVLCLALLLHATSGLHLPFLNIAPSSSPATSAPDGPTIRQFYVNMGPGWATLTIDGKYIANPPTGEPRQPLQLAQGRHQFSWRAAPFPAQNCSISVPASLSDTCTATETAQTPNGQLAWLIMFTDHISLQSLPATARNALTAAIQQATRLLQVSTIVYPGEHFLVISPRGGPISIAQRELRATLNLMPDFNGAFGSCNAPSSCYLNGQDCHELCTTESGIPGTWMIAALVHSAWTYATMDGHVIAGNMPDEQGGAAYTDHTLPLNITWDGENWHAHITPDYLDSTSRLSISCVSAADDISISNAFNISFHQAFNLEYLPASNNASGCLVVLAPVATSNSTPTTGTPIVYLHRFGLFLAVNRQAQEYDPRMPHPDAYEMKLAHEIAAQAHLSFT